MNIQEIISITIVLAAVFAYVNNRFIKWPPTIGIMTLSLASSILLAVLGHSFISKKALQLASAVDFHDVLMNFMLSFLLFAGAININAAKLQKERWAVLLLATLGILISTFVVGWMVWLLFGLFHLAVPFTNCLMFGALISPTDPIAVLAILKEANIPSSLETKISGESLFNDGVAVVVFMTIVEVARNGGDLSILNTGKLFLQEAGGGLLFGALLGYTGSKALGSIDDYKVEVLITLALVMGGYFIAGLLHISGPLAMVVAGIITGNKVREGVVLSRVSRDYLGKFWELIDEILNAVLFLFIGLEMLIIHIELTIIWIGLICILIALTARWVSVSVPVAVLRHKIKFERHVVTILTWGGLRGGLSVAMALSLGASMYRDEFVLMTYIIVVFSIIVQGLTIGPLTKKLIYG